MAKGFFTVFVTNYQLNPAGIQFLVGLTTLLMVIRFGLDIYRHRSNNETMRWALFMLDGAAYSLLPYSLGVMQRPSVVNSYYQVWAVLLVTLRYSVKHGRPSGIALRQTPLADLMSSFWAANILRSRAPLILKIPVWLLWSINSARIIHGFVSMERANATHRDNVRLVAEYMRREHQPSVATDPATMEGYRYLVQGEDEQKKEAKPPRYKLQLKLTHKGKLITLDKIWEWAKGNESAHGRRVSALLNSRNGTLKNMCLSFALYKLLRRRFYNLPIHESNLVKTKRLIFDGILGAGSAQSTHQESGGAVGSTDVSSGQEADHHNRVFRITKAELSFLNDFFYSRHALIFSNGFPFLRLFLSTLLVGAISYMAFAIHQYSKIAKLDELGRVRHGVFFTWVLLSLLGLKEIIEVAGYVFSDWTKVLLVCNYARQPWWLRGWVMEKVVRLLCRYSLVKRWHGKMGQYNLLFGRGRRRSILAETDLPEEVQKAVFLSLRSLRNPSQGSYLDRAMSTSLFADELREKIHEKVSALDGDVHKILLWHIATCYCELHLAGKKRSVTRPRWVRWFPTWASPVFLPFFLVPLWATKTIVENFRSMNTGVWTGPFVEQSELGEIKKHYITAISLSQYCAHVLRLKPPLIPGNEILNKGVLDTVISETICTLRGCYSVSAIFPRLQRLTQPQDDNRSSLDIREDESATRPQDDTVSSSLEIREDEAATRPQDDSRSSLEVMEDESTTHSQDDNDTVTLLKMGSELGQVLINEIVKDETDASHQILWAFLAQLWAGFLLHLAKSTRASHHKLYLRTGGVLITHLWALMSHAGLMGDVAHGEMGNNTTPDQEPQTLVINNAA